MTRRKNEPVKHRKRKLPLALEHKDYLTLLSKSKNAVLRKRLIDAGDTNQIRAVAECVKNILDGNVPLSQAQLKKLKKHSRVMREVTKYTKSQTKRKRLLKQSGGFLQMLLPIALNALSGLFSQLTSK
jgi:hypothetical protein